jgi:hypothetical protein
MKVWSSRLLAIYTFAALLPATVFLAAGLIFFVGAIAAIFDNKFILLNGGIDYEFLYLTLSYPTGLFAIWQFWAFAIATIREEQVLFSWRLRLAILFGCISAMGVILIAGLNAFVFTVLPVCVLLGLLMRIQYRRIEPAMSVNA